MSTTGGAYNPPTPGNTGIPILDVDYYQDEQGQWRWRLTASNNRIVAAASEGFHNYADAQANLDEIRRATIVDRDG